MTWMSTCRPLRNYLLYPNLTTVSQRECLSYACGQQPVKLDGVHGHTQIESVAQTVLEFNEGQRCTCDFQEGQICCEHQKSLSLLISQLSRVQFREERGGHFALVAAGLQMGRGRVLPPSHAFHLKAEQTRRDDSPQTAFINFLERGINMQHICCKFWAHTPSLRLGSWV